MAIPDYQTLMLPLLTLMKDQKQYKVSQLHDELAKEFSLTDHELQELLPSGSQSVFRNRVGWARTSLVHAGLIIGVDRGIIQITKRGLLVLKNPPKRITVAYLSKYPEFQQFTKRTNKGKQSSLSNETTDIGNTETPEEQLAMSYQALRQALAEELLRKILQCSPSFFELLVVKLLVALGYGGSLADAGHAIGKSGDEGIDGYIKEDRLGLDVIYVQAKRWGKVVGRPVVQAFSGSLDGQRAKKGILITTSDFTKDARSYVEQIEKKIVLINGEELANLMIDFNVAVSMVQTYVVKKIDEDFFEGE